MKTLITISHILINIFAPQPELCESVLINNFNVKQRENYFNLTVEFIKSHEGFRSEPYICSAGYKTIGYGCIIKYSDNITYLDKKDAEKLLKQRLIRCLNLARLHFPGLNKRQHVAVTHLIYCKGIGTVLKKNYIKNNKLDSASLLKAKYTENRIFEVKMFYNENVFNLRSVTELL